jgi:hypothetical protein
MHALYRLQGSYPDEELVSGTLGVDASTYASEGLLIWSDTCHPVTHLTGDAAAQELGANLAGLEAAAPLYDRCTNDALVSPPARGWHSADHAAPSAAAAAAGASGSASGQAGAVTPARGVKRTAAEAGLGDMGSPPTATAAAAAAAAGGGAGTPAGDVVSPAAKRRFLGYQRCFNCGSYAHGVSGCPQPVDRVRPAGARGMGGGGGEHCLVTRPAWYCTAVFSGPDVAGVGRTRSLHGTALHVLPKPTSDQEKRGVRGHVGWSMSSVKVVMCAVVLQSFCQHHVRVVPS